MQRKWCHRFVVKPSPNVISYPVKNSKFLLVCCFSCRKYQRTKSRFVTTAISVEPWINKNSSKSSIIALVNAAGHSCFSLRASNPREHFDFRSRFLCFQTANQKIQINSKILCPQSPSILVPRPRRLRDEKRAMGTRLKKPTRKNGRARSWRREARLLFATRISRGHCFFFFN